MSEMSLTAARKRIYWIVRNKIELLRDTGQTKDADFDNEAWEIISAQLDDLAALTATPAPQAGGDVRELRQVLELFAKDIFNLGWNQGEKEHTSSRGGEDYRSGKTKEHFWQDVEKALDAILALTATPAQPTPSGEVDGLVAEIDALAKRRHQAGPADKQFGEKLKQHWPRIRAALGGGWRPISEAPKDGTRVLVVGGRLVIERSLSLGCRERTTLDEAYIAKWAGDEADDANEWLIEMDEDEVTWWADPVWWKPITPPATRRM